MKTYWEFEDFKRLAIEMAQRIQERHHPEEIVAVMRGGMIPASIIAKYLRLPCGVFYPESKQLILTNNSFGRRIVFVEDLVAKGRTLKAIYDTMLHYPNRPNWLFTTCLIDSNYYCQHGQMGISDFMLISSDWIVFPQEVEEKVIEGDRGLFRDNSDSYAKT